MYRESFIENLLLYVNVLKWAISVRNRQAKAIYVKTEFAAFFKRFLGNFHNFWVKKKAIR